MKASEFLKKYEAQKKREANSEKDKEKEHSLRENALERAHSLDGLKVGSPYDWEDLERYREELDRMDRKAGRKADKP